MMSYYGRHAAWLDQAQAARIIDEEFAAVRREVIKLRAELKGERNE